MQIYVGIVDPARTFGLRQRVLRPNQGIAEIARDGAPPGALSFGASEGVDAPIISTATVYPERPPDALVPLLAPDTSMRSWRLRGVATEQHRRSEGLGKLVLDAIVEYISRPAPALLWCYARIGAREFYVREQFASHGEVFMIEDLGPHIVMYRTIDRAFRSEYRDRQHSPGPDGL